MVRSEQFVINDDCGEILVHLKDFTGPQSETMFASISSKSITR
jgi:hypothetical protein